MNIKEWAQKSGHKIVGSNDSLLFIKHVNVCWYRYILCSGGRT